MAIRQCLSKAFSIPATVRHFRVLPAALAADADVKGVEITQDTDKDGLQGYDLVVERFKEISGVPDKHTDGTSGITFQEWEIVMKSLGFDAAHAKATFEAVDANGDGKITSEELSEYSHEFFFSGAS